jgi:hypothetical protein
MTLKDKLELGLKDDAPVRRDNLLYFPKRAGGPETQPGDLTSSPEEPLVRQDAVDVHQIARRLGSRPEKPAAKPEEMV